MIILLSGTSSSGKSTIARALVDRLRGPRVLLEADRSFPHVATPGTTPPIVVFHRSVVAWCHAGYDVVLDGSLPSGDPVLADQCLRALDGCDVRVVGVECSPAVHERRERSRPEARPLGWAAQQRATVHSGVRLDGIVDSTDGDTARHVEQLMRLIR